MPRDPEERLVVARRLVAERCIYGVDINPFAVEMAKMSIWLVTLAKGRPFGFIDHALRCGDSLVGATDFDQLRFMHLDSERGRSLHKEFWFDFGDSIAPAVDEAQRLREELEAFPVVEPADAERKAKLHDDARRAITRARLIGDAVAACAMADAAGAGDVDTLLKGVREGVAAAVSGDRVDDQADSEHRLDELDELLNVELPEGRPRRRTFHWPLEFPEVYAGARLGFDAIIANPPFLGGKRISAQLGGPYREYLVEQVGGGRRGNADLAAFFIRRFALLARPGSGTVGSLATNSIAQGDTREVGLRQIVDSGTTIVRGVQSRKWPGSANLEIAELWLFLGEWHGGFFLDGQRVNGIWSLLHPSQRVSGEPLRLEQNRSRAFQGCVVLGKGFVLRPDEAFEIIARDPNNADVIQPYVNGRDVSSSPDQGAVRYVINFREWSLEQATAYPDALRIVQERVRPERMKKKVRGQREFWWRFWNPRPAMHRAIGAYGARPRQGSGK